MSSSTIRMSGIDAVGEIPWGSHFCQFYQTEHDLIETLVPYFVAGLASNEACLWVTAGVIDTNRAKSLLARALPNLDHYLAIGQMEIVSINQWYQAAGGFDPDEVLSSWLELEASSRQRGFARLRVTGDTSWVERSGWDEFMAYEARSTGHLKSVISSPYAPTRWTSATHLTCSMCAAITSLPFPGAAAIGSYWKVPHSKSPRIAWYA